MLLAVTSALLKPSVPVTGTVSRFSAVQPGASGRLSAAARRSAGRPACGKTLAQPPRQIDGQHRGECFLPDAAVSMRSVRRGRLRSGRAADPAPGQRAGLRMAADDAAHVEDAGPDRPKWANSSDPCRACRTVLPSITRTPTSGKVTPRSSATHGASTVIGTRAGRGGTIVWPKRAARRSRRRWFRCRGTIGRRW